jgi:hypothetical protein
VETPGRRSITEQTGEFFRTIEVAVSQQEA